MRAPVWVLFGVAALFGLQGKATFTGVITDDGCAGVGHTRMRMGPTDAECTLACIDAHDSAYVLEDGKDVFRLSDQKTPKEFAGRRVRVTGTLDAATKTIQVDAIAAVP
jgi:Protein of unknown function (DUF5818)